MTNVWIINHHALPPSESGGTRHYTLAQELIKHGFKPTIIAASRHYQSGRQRPMPEGVNAHLEEHNGVPFLWLRNRAKGKKSIARIIAMADFAMKIIADKPGELLAKPDIILGSSPDLFAAASACLVARRRFGVPFVLEIRDIWPDSLIELTGHSRYHPLILMLRFFERYVYRYASAIVTLLSEAEPYFRAHGAHGPVVVIPNGIVAPEDGPAPLPANDTFTVLYAGSHGIPNQLDTLIHAAALLKGEKVRFVLAGEGVRKAHLIAMAEELGLTNVEFRPPVPKREVPALLASADAFHLEFKDSPLYRWGVSPNKLYDYLLAARPVLYGARLDHNPVALADAGMTLPPGDAQALADGVRALMKLSPAEREAMGKRGREYVIEHHRFGLLGERLANTLRQVLAQSDK